MSDKPRVLDVSQKRVEELTDMELAGVLLFRGWPLPEEYLSVRRQNAELYSKFDAQEREIADLKASLLKANQRNGMLEDAIRHAVNRTHEFSAGCSGCQAGMDLLWERALTRESP